MSTQQFVMDSFTLLGGGERERVTARKTVFFAQEHNANTQDRLECKIHNFVPCANYQSTLSVVRLYLTRLSFCSRECTLSLSVTNDELHSLSFQEEEMEDPELDYKLRKTCRKMIKVRDSLTCVYIIKVHCVDIPSQSVQGCIVV